jgi:hypothetical protein
VDKPSTTSTALKLALAFLAGAAFAWAITALIQTPDTSTITYLIAFAAAVFLALYLFWRISQEDTR